eukprot:scaffold3377_cov105-Isochrysis_galbana.AAC.4
MLRAVQRHPYPARLQAVRLGRRQLAAGAKKRRQVVERDEGVVVAVAVNVAARADGSLAEKLCLLGFVGAQGGKG